MRRKYLLFCLMIFALLTHPTADATPLLALEPQQQIAPIGTQIALDLVISGLGAAGQSPSLGAYQLDIVTTAGLSYAGTVFSDAVLGDQLDLTGAGSLLLDTPIPGGVFLFGLSFEAPADLVALQAGTFRLARVFFDVSDNQPQTVRLLNVILSDEIGKPVDAVISGALVNVPEPSTALVFVSGIVAIALLKSHQV
jgi:hypothetical protein